ncbi:MAG: diguanylate cyclase, partial [Tissierellia bacterium]|nr:diguanylate cyclase [Tissierellia bacterium]
IIIFICIAIFVLIFEAWIYSNKKSEDNILYNNSNLIENIIFLSIYIGLIYISGFHESQYKFLFLFVIIANTIQYGLNIGMYTAIISSIIILAIDLIGVEIGKINSFFEADLVLSGVFIIVAWLLGYYVKLENQYRYNAMQLANMDELTSLYNHRYFHNALTKVINNEKDTNSTVCLLFIDIDHFKYYNDMYGHTAGDVVLRMIGDIFKKSVRENDIVARYGGEEFAIILPNTSEEEAVVLGDRIRDTIENTYFEGEENQPNGKITISAGVSCYPDKAKNKKELINMADDALYRAKFFNKNRVESYYSVLEELKSDIDERHIDLISSIKTLISVINAKDRYTYAHTDRVVIYCELMANYLGLSEKDKKKLRYGAYLHDIGKIQISKDILIKKAKLTEEEWEILKAHPQNGIDIVKPVEALIDVLPLIHHHHERHDGTGYPDKLKGEDIPYLVRILSVADSFDAMTSNRPYHDRKSYDEAIQELKLCSSTQFHPETVIEFINMLEENKDRIDFK